jgi:hypothetical protein
LVILGAFSGSFPSNIRDRCYRIQKPQVAL